jgi:hypothetical protein
VKIVRALLFYIVITGFTKKKITMYELKAYYQGGDGFSILNIGKLTTCLKRLKSLRTDNRGYVGASIRRVGSDKPIVSNRFIDKGLPYINSLVSWY